MIVDSQYDVFHNRSMCNIMYDINCAKGRIVHDRGRRVKGANGASGEECKGRIVQGAKSAWGEVCMGRRVQRVKNATPLEHL
jgi:hypothetical protein